MQVQHSQNIDAFVADQEIDAIGKMPKQRTMRRLFQTRKLPGILDDAMEHMIEFVEELLSQTGPLVFVPHRGSLNIEFRLRLESQAQSHPSDQR